MMDVIKAVFRRDAESGLSDRDRVLLSPVEKWRIFGRFPFKFLFHSLLCVLVLVEVYVIVSQFTTYYRAKNDIFFQYFLSHADPEDNVARFFSASDVLDFIAQTRENYVNLDNSSIGNFNLDTDNDGETDPITLSLYKFGNLTGNRHDAYRVMPVELFNLTEEEPLGPFNNMTFEEARKTLISTSAIEMKFWFDNHAATQFVSGALFRWVITVRLENTAGVYEGVLRTHRVGIDPTVFRALAWLPGSIILISSISLVLGLKAILAAFGVYQRTKKRWMCIPKERLEDSYKRLELNINPITEWESIPLTVKFDFFGTWYGVEIIGELFVIVAEIMGLFEDSSGMPISDLSRSFLGVGIIVICINMTKYFEYWKKFYTLVLTFQGSFKRNLRFVISVVPLFMGFATCGLLVFSPYSSRFESLDQSAISLFALLNGDDVHATFLDLGPRFPYKLFTNLYLFSFCMLFITAILNIFIFIIEDSYHAAKDFISNEADRHSRRFRATDTAAEKDSFDLPTLFDVLDDVMNNLPQERLQKLKEQRWKALSSGVSIPTAAAALVGRPGSFVGSLSQSFLAQQLAGINTDNGDITPRDLRRSSSRPLAAGVSSSDDEDEIHPPSRKRGDAQDAWPLSPTRKTTMESSSSTESSDIHKIIEAAQKDFLADVEYRIKAAQAEFSRKLARDLTRHLSGDPSK